MVSTPGTAFGLGGEGWSGVSLDAEPDVFDEVFSRLAKAGIRFR